MAKLTAFRAEYGTSIEIRGTWHKFTCAAEIELEPGDNATEVKAKAWNTVISEVEKHIKEVLE